MGLLVLGSTSVDFAGFPSEPETREPEYLGVTRSISGDGIRVILAPCVSGRLRNVVVRRNSLIADKVVWELRASANKARPLASFEIGRKIGGMTEPHPLRAPLTGDESYTVTIVVASPNGQQGLVGSTFSPSIVPRRKLLVGSRQVDTAQFNRMSC